MSVGIDYKNITARVAEFDRIFSKHQLHLLYKLCINYYIQLNFKFK